MPKVDVIMPAYNAARYLPTAIKSVIGQTFTDWKLFIVDDGSEDDTSSVVAPFLSQLGGKIKYIKQANSGVSAARNTGIRNSDSQFVAMLDADDVWLPCRLSESLKRFEGHPEVGLTYGFISRINSEGIVIDTFDQRHRYAEGSIAPYIYMRKIDLPTLTVTVRRSCLDLVGVFDEKLRVTEDRDLWFRIALRYEVALVPQILALYRTSPESITANPARMVTAQIQFIEKHFGANGCGILARRIGLARVYRQSAEELASRERLWAALGYSLRAIGMYPLDVSNARTVGSLLLRCAGLKPNRDPRQVIR